MTYPLSKNCYLAYASLLIPAAVGAIASIRDTSVRSVFITAALAASFAVCLSVVYSYTSDYQAQGRYIITLAIPLGIAIVSGLRASGRYLGKLRGADSIAQNSLADTFCICCLFAYTLLLAVSIGNFYVPSQFKGLLNGFNYWWPYRC